MPALILSSSAGRLEALHDEPIGPVPAHGPAAAVVCHPYPPAGGDMHNKVVFSAARALVEAGLETLRFNFRGTGRSEGEHDGGRGEVGDARAALDAAAELPPGRSLLMAGYSFGSFVGLSAALDDDRVAALVAIAPPVNFYDYTAIGRTDKPLLVVYAPDDELVPASRIERWVERFPADAPARPQLVAVPGGGHMFHGVQQPLRAAVTSWVEGLAASGP